MTVDRYSPSPRIDNAVEGDNAQHGTMCFLPLSVTAPLVVGDVIIYEFVSMDHKSRWSIGTIQELPLFTDVVSQSSDYVVGVRDWVVAQGGTSISQIRVTKVKSSRGEAVAFSPGSCASTGLTTEDSGSNRSASQVNERDACRSENNETVGFVEGACVTSTVRSAIIRRLCPDYVHNGTIVLSKTELRAIRAASVRRQSNSVVRVLDVTRTSESPALSRLSLEREDGSPCITDWAAAMDIIFRQNHSRETIQGEELAELYNMHVSHSESLAALLKTAPQQALSVSKEEEEEIVENWTAEEPVKALSSAPASQLELANWNSGDPYLHPLHVAQRDEEGSRLALLREESATFMQLAFDLLEDRHEIHLCARVHAASCEVEQLRCRLRKQHQTHMQAAERMQVALNEALETPHDTQRNAMRLTKGIEHAVELLEEDGCDAGVEATPLPLALRYDMRRRFRHVTADTRSNCSQSSTAGQSITATTSVSHLPSLSGQPLKKHTVVCTPMKELLKSLPTSTTAGHELRAAGTRAASVSDCRAMDDNAKTEGSSTLSATYSSAVGTSNGIRVDRKSILSHPFTFPGEAGGASPRAQRSASRRYEELEQQEKEIARLTILLTRERKQRVEAEQRVAQLQVELLVGGGGSATGGLTSVSADNAVAVVATSSFRPSVASTPSRGRSAATSSAETPGMVSLYAKLSEVQQELTKRLQSTVVTQTRHIEELSRKISKCGDEMRVHIIKARKAGSVETQPISPARESPSGEGDFCAKEAHASMSEPLLNDADADVVDIMLQRRLVLLEKERGSVKSEREKRLHEMRMLESLLQTATDMMRVSSTVSVDHSKGEFSAK